MEKKYLYFQPEYVSKFQCDGRKCPHNCCERGWTIEIDKPTYNKYLRLKPESKAQEITRHFRYDAELDKYFVKENPCAFLGKDKLCRIQRELGEKFLSTTCVTYPRYTRDFGRFFERVLTLSCPVAAEMILFERDPMKFEFVYVPEKIHSNGGKIGRAPTYTLEEFTERIPEIQIAMISILQERTLSINQRLIVLGFFLDKLAELFSSGFDAETLQKLIAAYESKKFLAEQVPLMLRTVTFDAKKFIGLILRLFESFDGVINLNGGKKFTDALLEIYGLKPDSNNRVSLTRVLANHENLRGRREIFDEKYSTFLENFLVNELLITCCPWRLEESVAKNYGVFVATYKIFELILFASTQKNYTRRADFLWFVDWFTVQFDHVKEMPQRISAQVPDDIFELQESLLEQ